VAHHAVTYTVGDLVFWGMPTTAEEYTSSEGRHRRQAFELAYSGDVAFEVDGDECSPTGLSNPQRGVSIAKDISAITRAAWKAIPRHSLQAVRYPPSPRFVDQRPNSSHKTIKTGIGMPRSQSSAYRIFLRLSSLRDSDRG
jgi:hypothetical protein